MIRYYDGRMGEFIQEVSETYVRQHERYFINGVEVGPDEHGNSTWSWHGHFEVPECQPINTHLPSCRQCDVKDLEVFHTSKRDGSTLCPTCFEERQDKRLAVQQIIQRSEVETAKRTTHPLDQW